MDLSIIYALVIVLGVIGFAFLISFLTKKGYISDKGLAFVSQTLGLTISVLDEMNLKQEKQIKKIGLIVKESLDFISGIYDNSEDIIEKAYSYAIKMCETNGVEINENRKQIIKTLIEMSLNNDYIK